MIQILPSSEALKIFKENEDCESTIRNFDALWERINSIIRHSAITSDSVVIDSHTLETFYTVLSHRYTITMGSLMKIMAKILNENGYQSEAKTYYPSSSPTVAKDELAISWGGNY